jgi:serine protease Do
MKQLVWACLAAALSFETALANQGAVAQRYQEVAASVVNININELLVRGADSKEAINIASQGSGVLISNDGFVLTVAHLVDTADEISVQFSSGELVKANVYASEPVSDIALL